MNFLQSVIKLNPSQTLRLVKERATFFAQFANDQSFDPAASQQPQNIAAAIENEKIFFTAPLVCPIENFSREEFLSLKKISVYKIQKIGSIYFFPCKIELPDRIERTAFLCATEFDENENFLLEEFFFSTQKIIKKSFCENEFFFSNENFLFAPTSFKLCRMEIEKNNWQLYDEVWKKNKLPT